MVAPFDCLTVVDAGDVDTSPLSLDLAHESIETHIGGIVAAGALPLAIGGDHSISLPVLRALARKHGPVGLVQFDSHIDTWDGDFGSKLFLEVRACGHSFLVASTVAVLLVLSGHVPATSAQVLTPAALSVAQIESMLEPRVGDHPGLGIVVGLIDPAGKRTIVSAGSAGTRPGRALDANTVFEIGSISKVFTSTLLADMVRRGEVSLDDPVAKRLPASVRVPARDGRDITLLSLATHTSGLPRMPDNLPMKDPENPYADYTVEQLYQFLGTCQLGRAVGESYEYSNLGAGLLGHALALKLGTTYEAALIERVLGPLAMKDTRIVLTPEMKARTAVGHTVNGYETANWDLPALAGAGAIRSTVSDMLTFLAANLGAGPAALQADFEQTQVPRHDTGKTPGKIGLGWHIRSGKDVEVIWHNGGTGGSHSFAGFDRKRRVAVVVLHNSAANIDDIGFHLLDPQFPLTPVKPPAKPRTEIRVDTAALEHYVGQYALGPAFVLAITREGDRLFLQATGQPRFQIFAETETRFFLKMVDAQLTFVKDASGKATEVILNQNGMDQTAKRK